MKPSTWSIYGTCARVWAMLVEVVERPISAGSIDNARGEVERAGARAEIDRALQAAVTGAPSDEFTRRSAR